MNIYEFVNSRDIREYWKKIGFVPNSVESAWIVWQSKNHTIAEKHAAWQWLIDNMPDCEVRGRWINTPQKSLHEFLRRYMATEKEMIAEFFKAGENAVYTYRAIWECESEWDEKRDALFATFDDAYADATDDEEIPPVFLEFEKRHIGAFAKSIRICMTLEKEPVFLNEEFNFLNYHDSEPYYDVFFNMYFAFPIPFEKGDILCRANPKFKNPNAFIDDDYVFECINPSDFYVTACGYRADGSSYESTAHSYLDYEKFEGRPEGDIRLLVPISKYIKGEIELDLLLSAHSIIRKELSDRDKDWLIDYEKKLIGLWG